MPKVSFIQVKGNSYLSDGFLSLGMYRFGDQVILIDSGGDESCAKDVNSAVEALGCKVAAIINTHCHPDHCGGNSFFQKKYPKLLTFAAYNEKFFIEDPVQAPRCFCSGAAPFEGLKNKYIAPQKHSTITNVIAPYEDQTIHDAAVRIVTLPGHTQGMVGVITADNVLYSGDALFGQQTLDKHPILFYTDIAATFQSFTKLEQLSVDACVLYHGGVAYDIPGLVAVHRKKLLQVQEAVVEIIKKGPCSVDALTQVIMQRYAVPNSVVSFTLTQTAMKAYLSFLEQEKLIRMEVVAGLLQAVIV